MSIPDPVDLELAKEVEFGQTRSTPYFANSLLWTSNA